MSDLISKLAVDRAEDVFALRQAGRAAAAAAGCDDADQVRFATALSELGREALTRGATASAAFYLEDDGAVRVDISNFPRAGERVDTTMVGVVAARKLVDGVTIVDGKTSSTVTVTIHPRISREQRKRITVSSLRNEMAKNATPRPLDELRLENSDLVATLSEIKAQQEQLVHLNDELEETNRGVMAMYGQLADELEETNRGVVALYAELDDKTVRLNEANEAKTRFLANVSHELRSPVNSILGLVRLLTDPDEDALSPAQHKQLALVESSGSSLLGLVNQLLDLAKAESGRLEPDIAPVNVPTLLGELRGSLRPLVRKGVSLAFDIPDLPIVETDAVLLGQVLRNLLTNALKYTTSGSIKVLATVPSAYELLIDVVDTGIGIAPEDQSKIFEEFYQVRGPLQIEQKGTGLGLPYARRVARILGGDIVVDSELGRGSTFSLRLPVQWQPLLTARHSPGALPLSKIAVGRVALIDDDPGFRTVLRGMLQGLAAQVMEASGGIEGLAMMREVTPDLAFIDLRMPDMDGADVIAEMATDLSLRQVPVVIVTSAQLLPNVHASLGSVAGVLAKTNINQDIVALAIADALHVQSSQ